MAKNLTDRSFLLEHGLDAFRTPRKTSQGRTHQFGKKTLSGMIVGLCTTYGKNKVGQATHWFAYFEGLQETEATTKTPSHFALNVGLVSFLTLGDSSPFHNLVPGSEVSSSHHLINMKFHSSLQL